MFVPHLFIKTDISFSIADKSINDPNAFISSISTLRTSISTRIFDDNFCNVFETEFEIYTNKNSKNLN